MGENNIKPCPFCGGEAKLERHSKTVIKGETVLNTYVFCKRCHVRGSRFLRRDYVTYADANKAAIEAWNRRMKDES